MSKALLIMAHGSRAEAANDEFRLLVEQVAEPRAAATEPPAAAAKPDVAPLGLAAAAAAADAIWISIQ